MKKLLLLSIALFIALLPFAQNKQRLQLSGKITDSKTGEPLAGASITLTEARIGTIADSLGNYTLQNVPAGHTLVEISFTGYKTVVEHIDMSANTIHNFQLVSSIIENEGVTVTGVAGPTSVRRSPVPITRISKSELLSTPSTNIIDALSKKPGISQLSTGPAISKPIIRGLGFNRLVVINDGIRQEGQQWGEEHGIEIDENSVNRVEILKGPGSLIYGSDAIAGVINIMTVPTIPQGSLRANIISGYQTNNRQRSLFASVGANEHDLDWNAWGDYRAAADYTNKYDGRVWNSKFNEQNFGGSLGLNKHWGFSHLIISNFNQKLGAISGERDAFGNFVKDLPGGVQVVPTTADFNSTDPQMPYQHIQHFKIISDNSFKAANGKLNVVLGYQRNQRTEYGNADKPIEKSLYFDLRTFNYRVAYQFEDHNGWRTSIGVSGMAQRNQNGGAEVLIPEYNMFDIGGYLYSQKTIDKLTLSGGLRYDLRTLQSQAFMDNGAQKFIAFNKNFSNVSGSIGASYAATQNLTLKANIARGFRAPSIPELASNGAHEGSNRYEYGEVNLGPEKSFQADAGIEWASEHFMINASAFYNQLNDFIFYRKLVTSSGADSTVLVNGNYIPAFKFGQQNAHLEGVEAGFDIHPHPLDWLHIQNTFSYVRGLFNESIEGTNDLPFIPPMRYIGDVKGEFLKKGKSIKNLVVSFEVDHTFKQENAFTAYGTETPTPGYTLFNASLSTDVNVKGKTLFSFYFNAINLTDVAYQSHLNRLKYTDVNLATGRHGVFNMGRNFSFKVSIPLVFVNKI
ncbi:MAG: TonB-dependent receptor [Chitinophagaceae bacterium]